MRRNINVNIVIGDCKGLGFNIFTQHKHINSNKKKTSNGKSGTFKIVLIN